MTTRDRRDLVAALLAVPGVAGADVEPDQTEESPGTLRLELVPGADEVAVATSVNRVLREHFGLAVDANRVQVVEDTASSVTEDPVAPGRLGELGETDQRLPDAEPSGAARLVIQRMQLVSAGPGVSARVTLGHDGRAHVGRADGEATPTGVRNCVAAATLRATEDVVGQRARFDVEHIEVSVVGSERSVLVVVVMATAQGRQRLSGVSGVRQDVRQAVIRATLDAVNRRVARLLQGAA